MDKAGIARHIAHTKITEAAMESESDSPDHHQQRSAFIRNLVQRPSVPQATSSEAQCIPRAIVQFWNNLAKLPEDVRECIATWSRWEASGFAHRVFDTEGAAQFIGRSFGPDHAHAFARCYHPAMQADYFRLCYLFVEGGMYVDADDVCMASNISSLFDGSSLKVQPLCYDIGSDSMVSPRDFLQSGANDDGWIFYFNNNPLIASPRDPIVRRALEQATQLLNGAADGEFPEIQSTTGPGNLSKAVFELGAASAGNDQVQVLKDWDSIAISRWPLSYRRDTRNWRLSNGKRFHVT